MGRSLLKVPILRTIKGGAQVEDFHRESNTELANKFLLALKRAPEGYRFPHDKLKAFKRGEWQPPVRPGAEDVQLDFGKLVKPPSSSFSLMSVAMAAAT